MNTALEPSAKESEEAILSCLLQQPDLIDEAAAVLTEQHFHFANLRTIWAAILGQHNDQRPVDPLTITVRLRESGQLDQVGGASAVMDIYTIVAYTPASFGWHIEQLRLAQTRRQAQKVGQKVIGFAYESSLDERMKVIGAAEEAMNDLHAGLDFDEVKPFRRWLSEAVDFVEEQAMRAGQLSGYSTGIDCIDLRTLGVCHGEAWIIAGGTSDGKTCLAMQICRALFSAEVPTAYYLTESSGVRLTLRAVASEARINLRSILTGNLSKGEQSNLMSTIARIGRMPFFLRHKPGIQLQELLADMRLVMRKHAVKVFFVDYIQRIDNSARENREQQIAEISRRLTDFANKTGCAVIMLSQLNDDGKIRESRAPTHDADVVLTISCPEERDQRGKITWKDETRRYITVGKARNSERGGKPLEFHFDGSLQTFTQINESEE